MRSQSTMSEAGSRQGRWYDYFFDFETGESCPPPIAPQPSPSKNKTATAAEVRAALEVLKRA
jgi:hypothetical protein